MVGRELDSGPLRIRTHRLVAVSPVVSTHKDCNSSKTTFSKLVHVSIHVEDGPGQSRPAFPSMSDQEHHHPKASVLGIIIIDPCAPASAFSSTRYPRTQQWSS